MRKSSMRNVQALPDEALLRPAEAARLVGFSRQRIAGAILSGVLPSSGTARDRRVRKADALAYARRVQETGYASLARTCLLCQQPFAGRPQRKYCSAACLVTATALQRARRST